MPEIVGEAKGGIDVKRFYLPGLVLKDTCPNCKSPVEDDLRSSYLSYPEIGTPFVYGLYCDECDHEWEFKLLLKVSLEIAP